MMLYDSTFFVDLDRELRRRQPGPAQGFLRRHAREEMAMSIITRGELARGFESRERWTAFCEGFLVLGLDDDILWRATDVFRVLRGSGEGIADNDLWIAATALQAEIPLVTQNPRHFRRVPGLEVVGYRDGGAPRRGG